MNIMKSKKKKFNNKKVDFDTIIFISVSKNNIIISITNMHGLIIDWFSSGCLKLKGFRKSSPLAAKLVAQTLNERIKNYEKQNFILKIKGFGFLKKMLLKYIATYNFNIIKLYDITKIAFNGCKAKKKRKL